MQINDSYRLLEHLPHWRFPDSVVLALVMPGVVRPTGAKLEALHRAREELGGLFRPIKIGPVGKHRRRHAMFLNVVNIKPESPEPDEILDGLPDDSSDRHRRHDSEHDNRRRLGATVHRVGLDPGLAERQVLYQLTHLFAKLRVFSRALF